MKQVEFEEIARRAELLYEQRLRADLEKLHRDDFVAIEPESGDHYLGSTLHEAVRAARKAHPNRLCHVLRVGHATAIHIGAWRQ